MPSQQEIRGYLKRQFELNPYTSAEAIVYWRNQWLGVGADDGNGPGKELLLAKRRMEIKQALDGIRETFWQTEEDLCAQRLEELSADGLPELKLEIRRLKDINALKPQFLELASKAGAGPEFIRTLRNTLIAGRFEAIERKDGYLKQLPFYNDYRSLKSLLSQLRRKYPKIYSLEPEWFDAILNFKKENKFVAPFKASGCGWWILAWAVLKLIQYIVM